MPKKPQRLAEDWWFVLPTEQTLPLEEQGRFQLKPLTLAERLRVRDERSRLMTNPETGEVVIQGRAWQQLKDIVLDHLVATENVPSDAPEPWPGLDAAREKREAWLERNLEDLTIAVVGVEIRERSFLGGPLKN